MNLAPTPVPSGAAPHGPGARTTGDRDGSVPAPAGTGPDAAPASGAGADRPDPRSAVDALTTSRTPYLLGVRHHSPALAAVIPALLDASGADVVCVELPADFQDWLPHLADPETRAPVALAGAGTDGRLAFYPFADFSPELAALRWARERGARVLCCDLPLADRGWAPPAEAADAAEDGSVADAAPTAPEPARGTDTPRSPGAPPSFADALTAAGTGRDGDDLWDRAVEVLAPGCPPEAVRRAALGVGWALRQDAAAHGGIPATDLAREAHMRRVVASAAAEGGTVAAVIGAFHAPALLTAAVPVPADGLRTAGDPAHPSDPSEPAALSDPADPADPAGPSVPAAGAGAPPAGPDAAVTSLVPYSFDLLDSRSGYPAGIRDPLWQQAVLRAGGDPDRLHAAAARAVTDVCRELRAAGHTAGTGEAAETLRLACDLARLRGLPAPGRGELLEAVTTVLGHGEPLGRGRALAAALETVLVGTGRGVLAPGTPRSGLGPDVEAELARLRLPCPENPEPREVRLDPLRSELDGRREILLQRLAACGAGYGTPLPVAATGDGTALGTRWRLSWTPAVPARLDLAGVRGVTAAMAAAGTLRETARREAADGGATCARILAGLDAAARCDLPELVTERLAEAAAVLPASATLPELLQAVDLLEALHRGHLPGTGPEGRAAASDLAAELLESAVGALPGLAGSDDDADAAALVALADRAAGRFLGLRLDGTLGELVATGSPLMQGAALAVRVLLDLDPAAALGRRVTGWIDTATDADGRRRLTRRLRGLLSAAGPLLATSATALDPLLDRVDGLTDPDFLDRLPALRGGFDALSPAARDRLLHTVTARLGDRVDLSLDAPAALLALWAAADAAGLAAVASLPAGLRPDTVDAAGAEADTDSTETATELPRAAAASAGPARRIQPADRWRLLLGRQHDRLPSHARRYALALDELYGAGRGEGADEIGGGGAGGGQEAPFPTAREWSEELEALFGADVREEVLAGAADAGRTDVLTHLDPAAVRPSVELLTSVLSLAGGLPERQLQHLRPLVKRLVDELAEQLSTRLRPALTGITSPRPTRRPGGRLDLPRTLRANLAHTRLLEDGTPVVVPERPVFHTRVSRAADWRLVLVVDVSGSMEASVVWSALTAAVLGGVPTLSTHFLAFSTQVVDLTDRVDDPLSLLLDVRVGGGTHIASALAHARTLVTVPSRTLVVVVSDFEEGAPLGGLLAEVRALAGSGAHLLGCAALDDTGTPRYSVPVARQLVAAGMPVAALSPLALARWVGDRLRGEAR
ncbi:vWA domain-containing protein [Streptomyces lavendulocolor]|uniref:vWA domain-containing protein n=1 Tax=Streptomyces lavendulocolor TaxID=67316 RepID=UPI003C2FC2BF